MFLGILSVAAIIFLLWLLFTLAVYALPLWAGGATGWLAYETGAGWVGAAMVGIVVAGLTLGFGEAAIARLRSPIARVLVTLLFAGPAAIAGYHAALGILKWSVPSETWRMGLSVVVAVAVAIIAATRFAAGHVTGQRAPQSPEREVVSLPRAPQQTPAWRRTSRAR